MKHQKNPGAVVVIMHGGSAPPQSSGTARTCLNTFRGVYYRCLTRRADELFELTDALLCAEGKVTDLAHRCYGGLV